MSERESTLRIAIVTFFPMFIATLSLITSIYNGYLNSKFIDLIQRNLNRAESLHTCKEILDAHAQVVFRASQVSEIAKREAGAGGASALPAAQLEATNALIKFRSLATYLANLHTEARARYTQLVGELTKIVEGAAELKPAEVDQRFAAIDTPFNDMNEDCVRIANQ